MMRSQFRSEDVVRDGSPPPCNTRPCYATCKKICPEVERWVSQDHIGRSKKEVLQVSVPDMDIFTNEFIDHLNITSRTEIEPDPQVAREAWLRLKSLNLTESSMEFARLYYREGKKLNKVAAILGISSQAADGRHNILKGEVREKLQRQEVWESIKDVLCSKLEAFSMMTICLYYHDLMTFGEIAEITGMAYSTIHGIIRKFKIDNKID